MEDKIKAAVRDCDGNCNPGHDEFNFSFMNKF